MNKIRLDALKVKVSDPYMDSHEVIVNFEYERLSKNEMKFFLEVYLGEDQFHYCFLLKIIFIIEFQYEIHDENQLLDESISLMIEPLMNIIIMIDTMVHQEQERFT